MAFFCSKSVPAVETFLGPELKRVIKLDLLAKASRYMFLRGAVADPRPNHGLRGTPVHSTLLAQGMGVASSGEHSLINIELRTNTKDAMEQHKSLDATKKHKTEQTENKKARNSERGRVKT